MKRSLLLKGNQSEGGGGDRIGKQRNGDRQCVGDKTRDLAEVLNVFGKWREKRKCCVSWKKRKQTVCVSGGAAELR